MYISSLVILSFRGSHLRSFYLSSRSPLLKSFEGLVEDVCIANEILVLDVNRQGHGSRNPKRRLLRERNVLLG
jgi:hypothetical protein